jgi:hypothetical protein
MGNKLNTAPGEGSACIWESGSMKSLALPASSDRFMCSWLFGRNADLLFFFLPVVYGVMLFALAQAVSLDTNPLIFLLALDAFGAGPLHLGPTLFVYLDKNNRNYWKSVTSRRIIFFLGPALVILLSVGLNVYATWLGQLVALTWSIQHIVQQNCGILLLYHDKSKGEAVVDRGIEMRSQQIPAIAFSLFYFYRLYLTAFDSIFWKVFFGGLAAFAVYSVVRYLWEVWKQVRGGALINLPAMAFWFVSVISFMPFAFFGKNYGDAILIPVTIHWCQYLGLNFHLVKNKYNDESQAGNLPAHSAVLLLLLACVSVMGIWFVFKFGSVFLGHGLIPSILGGVVMGISNTHFMLDAFLWRFRDSFVRESTLPYLMHYRRTAQAPT